jgi:hypothetical protein
VLATTHPLVVTTPPLSAEAPVRVDIADWLPLTAPPPAINLSAPTTSITPLPTNRVAPNPSAPPSVYSAASPPAPSLLLASGASAHSAATFVAPLALLAAWRSPWWIASIRPRNVWLSSLSPPG